jgi:hypothetical protein
MFSPTLLDHAFQCHRIESAEGVSWRRPACPGRSSQRSSRGARVTSADESAVERCRVADVGDGARRRTLRPKCVATDRRSPFSARNWPRCICPPTCQGAERSEPKLMSENVVPDLRRVSRGGQLSSPAPLQWLTIDVKSDRRHAEARRVPPGISGRFPTDGATMGTRRSPGTTEGLDHAAFASRTPSTGSTTTSSTARRQATIPDATPESPVVEAFSLWHPRSRPPRNTSARGSIDSYRPIGLTPLGRGPAPCAADGTSSTASTSVIADRNCES